MRSISGPGSPPIQPAGRDIVPAGGQSLPQTPESDVTGVRKPVTNLARLPAGVFPPRGGLLDMLV